MLCSRYGVDLVSIWCRYDTITVLYYTTGALDTPPPPKIMLICRGLVSSRCAGGGRPTVPKKRPTVPVR